MSAKLQTKRCETVGELKDFLEDIPDHFRIDEDSQFPTVYDPETDPVLVFEDEDHGDDDSEFIIIDDDGEVEEED